MIIIYVLRYDIKQLGTILGQTIKDYDPEVFQSVEKLRQLGREWRLPNGYLLAGRGIF